MVMEKNHSPPLLNNTLKLKTADISRTESNTDIINIME